MKKLILAAVVFGSVTVLVSCKKDRICTCDGKVLGYTFTADTTYTDMTKKEAESECNTNDFTYGTDNYAECELK